MTEPKTQKTDANVEEFLESVSHDTRRRDSFQILELMREVTGESGAMWGESIVGFGTYEQVYASGEIREWPLIGFSPRKQNLTLYLRPGFETNTELLDRLGKYKTGKVCLYLNKLADVDMNVLSELIRISYATGRSPD